MNTEKMLVLSTAHISEATKDVLDGEGIEGVIHYDKEGFGWWIFVSPGYKEVDMPADVMLLMITAEKNDCKWIMLDCDVPVDSTLPSFDW
jgi:hypothetical protein